MPHREYVLSLTVLYIHLLTLPAHSICWCWKTDIVLSFLSHSCKALMNPLCTCQWNTTVCSWKNTAVCPHCKAVYMHELWPPKVSSQNNQHSHRQRQPIYEASNTQTLDAPLEIFDFSNLSSISCCCLVLVCSLTSCLLFYFSPCCSCAAECSLRNSLRIGLLQTGSSSLHPTALKKKVLSRV